MNYFINFIISVKVSFLFPPNNRILSKVASMVAIHGLDSVVSSWPHN